MDYSDQQQRFTLPQKMNIQIVFQQPINPNQKQKQKSTSKQTITNQQNQSQSQTQNGFKQTIELIQDFPIRPHIDSQTQSLNLFSLAYQLTKQYNISFQNNQIHFYLQQPQLYMNCGIDPISKDIKIPPNDYLANNVSNTIKIKIRKIKNISILHKLMSVDSPIENHEEKEKQEQSGFLIQQNPKSRRTKQRRIGYIIQKVIQWRSYYQGTSKNNAHTNKLSLQQAADQVKISKKSLDDYLFQIRFGNRYGFNFNQHYNEKVGVLRDFVRQKKKTEKTEVRSRKRNNDNSNVKME